MRRTWFGLALMAGLSMPVAAAAADNTVVGVGTGAVAGAVVGGPIGAVVGAVAGGFIGANTPSARSRYRRRTRARHYRDARRPVPRAYVAERAQERITSQPAVSSAPVSEVSTQPRVATTGSTQRAPGAGWQDPH